MEVSRNSIEKTRKRKGLGRCRHFFWLGVVFDSVGAMVLFTGVFADLLFYDLLLYLGSIIIFLSLLWWVFWYTGNIELAPDETLKNLYRLPSAALMKVLSQTGSSSFSFTMRTFSNTLGRLRQGRRHWRLHQRTGSPLSRMLTGQGPKQLAKEDPDKGEKKSGDAEDLGREDLGLEQEAVKNSEGVCDPGPDAGPVGPEARQPPTYLVQPEFTPSLDQPLPPTILASKSMPVVPLSSTSQPLSTLSSKSLPILSLASVSQPSVTLASASLPAVPLTSTGQLLDTLALEIQTVAPMASQSHLWCLDCRDPSSGPCSLREQFPESFSGRSNLASGCSGSPSRGSGHPGLPDPAFSNPMFSEPTCSGHPCCPEHPI